MDSKELAKILEKHQEWCKSPARKGEQADLRKADLGGADLNDANLSGADLRGANLAEARLNGANLSKSCLIEADMRGADMRGANLTGASLIEAYLDEVDFRLADLRQADLSGACLIEANLGNAYLREVFLCGANLSGANLIEANLRQAELTEALLYNANLWQANLNGANLLNAFICDSDLYSADLSHTNLIKSSFINTNLDNADMTRAVVYKTSFCSVDLSKVQGLESIVSYGPNTLGIDTIYRSRGQISSVFLKNCGLPDNFTEYMQTLTKTDYQNYSCFICYSIEDQDFAYRLYTDLQNQGIRCWFTLEEMQIGDWASHLIEDVIHDQQMILLVLSSISIHNKWIEKVFKAAFNHKLKSGREILFPVLIDDIILKMDIGWTSVINQSSHICDFTLWKDQESYARAFEELKSRLKLSE